MCTVDDLYKKKYDAVNYNCTDFAADVVRVCTGMDVSALLKNSTFNTKRRHFFKKTAKPVDYCIALMRRKNSQPHLGVFMDNRIIHLTEKGVEFFPPFLAGRGFTKIDYYKIKNNAC